MAAGAEAASSGGRSSSSSAVLEATLDRRFQGVTNTMESIQSLSSWCLENKKHHGVVVRSWMKWLKKCELLWLALYTNTNRSSSLVARVRVFLLFFWVFWKVCVVYFTHAKRSPCFAFACALLIIIFARRCVTFLNVYTPGELLTCYPAGVWVIGQACKIRTQQDCCTLISRDLDLHQTCNT